MSLALIAALLTLAEPAGPTPITDEAKVVGDQPAAAIAPAAEPLAPAVPAPPPSVLTAPPPPTAAEPLPSPPPAETIDETGPASPLSRPSVRPAGHFGLEMGYARGGDRFLTVLGPTITAAVNAGDGVFFALAGSWTPYWSERGIGVGVYARAGAKYVAVGNSMTAVSFLRVPLAAGAQLLLPVVGRWFALGRLGVITEVLEELAATNGGVSSSSRNFSPRLGAFLDVGMHWAATEHSGFAAIVRYERLDVEYSGDVINATNLGMLAAAFLGF